MRRHLESIVATCILGLVRPGMPAHADEKEKIKIEAPSQSMKTTLEEIDALSTMISIVMVEDVSSIVAPPISGSFTPYEALERLLPPAGLQYFVGTATDERNPNKVKGTNITVARAAKKLAESSEPFTGTAVQTVERLAATEYVTIHNSNLEPIDLGLAVGRPQQQRVDEIDRRAIERSGANSVNALLLMARTNVAPQTGGGMEKEASAIRLRGFGTTQTLILQDGHRLAPFGIGANWQQPDIDAAQLNSIERIEIGTPTQSAVFGGFNTGFINVIRRRDFSGIESTINYGKTFDMRDANSGGHLRLGSDWMERKIHAQVDASFSSESVLRAGERPYLVEGRNSVSVNNPAAFTNGYAPPLAATANIMTALVLDPETMQWRRPPLTLKTGHASEFFLTSVPFGYAGAGADGGIGLIENAGRFNWNPARTSQPGGADEALINGRTRKSVTASLSSAEDSIWRGILEVSASWTKGFAPANGADSVFVLSPSDPANPFNETVIVTVPAEGAGQDNWAELRNLALFANVSRRFNTWTAQADYVQSSTRYAFSTSGSLFASAGNAVKDGTINVFADPERWTNDFSSWISRPTTSDPTYGVLKDLTLQASGPIGALPGGNVQLRVLVEGREERLNSPRAAIPGTLKVISEGFQRVFSVLGGVTVPLLSVRDASGRSKLDLQMIGRYDSYDIGAKTFPSDFYGFAGESVERRMHSITPIVELNFRPTREIAFELGYARSQLPPTPPQLISDFPVTFSGAMAAEFGPRDPRRGYEPVGDVEILVGGSATLMPQKSESWMFGITWTPIDYPGSSFGGRLIRINEKNAYSAFPFTETSLLSERLIPSLVTRATNLAGDPFDVGPINRYDGRLMNTAEREVDAADLSFDHTLRTESHGQFQFAGRVTRMLRDRVRNAPGGPFASQLELLDSLKTNAVGEITWQLGKWEIGVASHYFSSYYLNAEHVADDGLGIAKLDEQIYHNVSLAYRLDRSKGYDDSANGNRRPSRWEFRLQVTNATNSASPIALSVAPYYSLWNEPRGRTLHAGVTYSP